MNKKVSSSREDSFKKRTSKKRYVLNLDLIYGEPKSSELKKKSGPNSLT